MRHEFTDQATQITDIDKQLSATKQMTLQNGQNKNFLKLMTTLIFN